MLMIDKEKAKATIANATELDTMNEFSGLTALIRDRFYEHGHTPEEVNALLFTAFRIGMENLDKFPPNDRVRKIMEDWSAKRADTGSKN